jgi:hypothetical protein
MGNLEFGVAALQIGRNHHLAHLNLHPKPDAPDMSKRFGQSEFGLPHARRQTKLSHGMD